MKKKNIFISLLLLVAVISNGQNTLEIGQFGKRLSNFKKDLIIPDSKDKSNIQKWAIKRNRSSSQSEMLKKSARATKQRLDSINAYSWDESASQWVESRKEKFTYDADGNVSQYLEYNWDEYTNQWRKWKGEYTYNTNGDVLQYFSYRWDESKSKLVKSQKEEYTYNADRYEIEYIIYDWNESTSQWVKSGKTKNTYDTNGYEIKYISYDWDGSTSQWVERLKIEYIYDLDGNILKEYSYDWDENNGTWIEYQKEKNTYDTDGNETRCINYIWVESTSQWVASDKVKYIYDANGNEIHYINFDWDESTGQWFERRNIEYTYNNTFTNDDLILPFFFEDEEIIVSFNHMITSAMGSMNYKGNNADTLVEYSKSMLYYSEQDLTSTNYIENGDIQLYPNPVSEYLNINFRNDIDSATFELFDMLGNRQIFKKVSNNEHLMLGGLNKGVYLFNLYIDGNRQSGKLIKE